MIPMQCRSDATNDIYLWPLFQDHLVRQAPEQSVTVLDFNEAQDNLVALASVDRVLIISILLQTDHHTSTL